MPYIIDTLEQTEYWYGQGGFPYLVTEMELSHKINVLAHLLRSIDTLYAQKVWRDTRIRGEDPDHLIGQDPLQWLVGTPLFQEMRMQIKRAGAIPPDMEEIEGGERGQEQAPRGAREEGRRVIQIGPGSRTDSA